MTVLFFLQIFHKDFLSLEKMALLGLFLHLPQIFIYYKYKINKPDFKKSRELRKGFLLLF